MNRRSVLRALFASAGAAVAVPSAVAKIVEEPVPPIRMRGCRTIRIKTTGCVGLGLTTYPATPLHVYPYRGA